jgi:hypothetical protein
MERLNKVTKGLSIARKLDRMSTMYLINTSLKHYQEKEEDEDKGGRRKKMEEQKERFVSL